MNDDLLDDDFNDAIRSSMEEDDADVDSVDNSDTSSASVSDAGPSVEQEHAGEETAEQTMPANNEQAGKKEELLRTPSGLLTNRKGDLFDPNGQLIATSGVMRRLHERSAKFEREIDDLKSQLQERDQRILHDNAIISTARKVGLSDDDLSQAFDLAARFKSGKVLEVAKEVVARAMAAGHNVTEIVGEEVGDSVDMRAIRELIDQRLSPITSEQRQVQEAREAEQRAMKMYTDFVSEHEHADIHSDAIAKLAKTRNISPQKAYYELRTFAVKQNLDFSQPLQDQLLQRAQNRAQPQQPQNKQERFNPPLPAQSRGVNEGQRVRQINQAPANVDSSYADIIREAMNITD